MGLDIYFRKYDNFEKTKELEGIQEDYENTIWEQAGEYDSLSDEQKASIREKIKAHSAEIGLDSFAKSENIEIDHPDYPDHYFKLGYFRSSYNSSGIERILKNLGLPTLHDVFEREDDSEYESQPDWEGCLARAQNLLDKFRLSSPYRVEKVDGNIFKTPDVFSEADALKVFLKELEGKETHEYNYSNSSGEFYLAEPMKVSGMIPGRSSLLGGERDCIYVIYESDNSWYEQAIQIVIDTLKMVIDSPDRGKIYMAWSS